MTHESGSWPPGQAAEPVHPQSHPSVDSGPVSPWAHAPYLPPVEPVPAPVLPPAPVAPTSSSGSWVVAPTPAEGRWRPGRVQALPGTQFGVVHLQVAPITSGMAVGALMAGIAAILVSFLVLCFGVAGAADRWGAWVAGAFTVLGGLAGAGAAGLGMASLRQIRRSGAPGLIRFTGRGVAIGGIVCGAAGLGISVLALALSLWLQLS